MTKTRKQQGYEDFTGYWDQQMADPEFRRIYDEEAAKKELWLQLVEARMSAGLTQQELATRYGATVSTLPSHYLFSDSHPDEEKRFRPLMRERKRCPEARSDAPADLRAVRADVCSTVAASRRRRP